MQYIPCNSALLAQEALFLPKKALFCPQISKKPPVPPHNFCHPVSTLNNHSYIFMFISYLFEIILFIIELKNGKLIEFQKCIFLLKLDGSPLSSH